MKTRKELKAKSFRANEEIIQNTGDEKELLLFFFLEGTVTNPATWLVLNPVNI